MVVPVAVLVKMQGQRSAMRLVQHVNDGRAVGLRESNRRAEKAERVSDGQ